MQEEFQTTQLYKVKLYHMEIVWASITTLYPKL